MTVTQVQARIAGAGQTSPAELVLALAPGESIQARVAAIKAEGTILLMTALGGAIEVRPSAPLPLGATVQLEASGSRTTPYTIRVSQSELSGGTETRASAAAVALPQLYTLPKAMAAATPTADLPALSAPVAAAPPASAPAAGAPSPMQTGPVTAAVLPEPAPQPGAAPQSGAAAASPPVVQSAPPSADQPMPAATPAAPSLLAALAAGEADPVTRLLAAYLPPATATSSAAAQPSTTPAAATSNPAAPPVKGEAADAPARPAGQPAMSPTTQGVRETYLKGLPLPLGSGQPDAAPRPLAPASPGIPPASPVAPAAPVQGQPQESSAPSQPPAQAAPAPQPAVSPAVALARAVFGALARQDSAAPLLATAEGLTPPQKAALPQPVRQALDTLVAQRIPLADLATPEGVKRAVQQSGLFLEARLAAGGVPEGVDLKAVLLQLRSALKSVVPAEAEEDDAPRAERPAAPYKGDAPRAEPAQKPIATAGQEPTAILRKLLVETEAALDRHRLVQAASLHEGAQGGPPQQAQQAQQSPHWMMEVPVAMGRDTAVMEMMIDRDAPERGPNGEPKPATWRMRFSIDLAESGPVHARLAQMGSTTSVSLWAERHETADQLKSGSGELMRFLADAELEPGEIVLSEGAPPRPAEKPAGRFLDRST